ncbi:MAG: TolC family protein [Bacteroidetes bacterium]|nr:MAG: TolC family protein [Bacteroidota bacterium]
MNKRVTKRSILPVVILFLSISNIIDSQTSNDTKLKTDSDSLSLKDIIEKVISDYPTVKVAEEAISNADARIGLARTGYYPEADMTANFSNIGPVTKLSIPDMGTFQLYPENNYSASINYRQVLYDFGRTRQNIELENESKAIGEQALQQVKQKLSLYTVNNFYSLVFLQAAVKIKIEQIAALNEHLEYVEKMMASGSATEYQILATKVKISAVESQKVDLIASLTAQQASLNSLLGNDHITNPVVRNELSVEIPIVQSDSALSFAFHNRGEVLINEERTSLAGLKYGMTRLQNKPILSFIASGGAKNGYIPNLYKVIPNYVVGLGFRIPIFDGMKNKYNLLQAQSAITSLSYESEFTKRNISNELYESEAYMYAAEKKITQFNLQLAQALKAYSLAQTSFKAGMITNLDLLDANTAVSESRLMLLKARIDFAASVYKLKAALGEKLY